MSWKRFFMVAFALLIAVSMNCTRLAAQATINTGSIQGVVTDAHRVPSCPAQRLLSATRKQGS
jgi:hypothetical protein